MCKCLQYCLESCYWHLIEKRFCYDESIALYEDPEKEEKNNNFFDNLAFYDSVSVIAGRAIVTIDPKPEEKPIVQQPRKIRWVSEEVDLIKKRASPPVPVPIPVQILNVPVIYETAEEHEETHEEEKKEEPEVTPEINNAKPKKFLTLQPENLEVKPEPQRKSLRERRMSKSLSLKIDQPKELPLVRQQSMPKFYLDTPSLEEQAAMFRQPTITSALISPVPKSVGFNYDLYSVVQIENERAQSFQVKVHRKESERSSRILLMKDRIMLKRSKSSLGTSVTNLPHSHHHI